MLQLDLIQTLAFAGVVLFAGHRLLRVAPLLARHNIPAPVIGGLLVAVIALVAHQREVTLIQFDTTLQQPLMVAFFTCMGLSASVSLLRAGGPQVVLLLCIATAFAAAQNVVGIGVASLFGLPPLFGVLAGSVTLTGGPATGLAFAPLFEQAGINGAATIALAAAMAGIVSGGLIGGPVSTYFIRRGRAEHASRPQAPQRYECPEQTQPVLTAGGDDASAVLRAVVIVLVAMWLGSCLSKACAALGLTFPATVGAMLAGAAIRGLDDATGWLRLPHQVIDTIGTVSLALFLVVALMTLELWKIAGLALPLVSILAVQVIVVALACWPLFRLMGRDYEAAVMGGGFIGFMLGTTANALAVMGALVERYGPAPRAFLAVPIVGAFFIDFVNALLITACLNAFA